MEPPTVTIPGYTYGTARVPQSPVSMRELAEIQVSAGFTHEDRHYLRLAGTVLQSQVERIVEHWRSGIIAGIPRLAAHSRSPDGAPLPNYLASSNRRFERWILDTCLRPYDQQWIDYQQEIAARHTTIKKNQTDMVRSTPYVPLRDIIAFIAVMNETIKPYLETAGHSLVDVQGMHRAWCKSMQIQMALWTRLYTDVSCARIEW